MAAALDELRSEVAKNPSDAEALTRFGLACLAGGEAGALHDWVATLLGEVDAPDAVRPPARALGSALAQLAAESDDPAEALELYLRAARLLGELGDAPDAAAEALASAWRIRPDERVGAQAHALLGRPAIATAPEYLLVALSRVGSEATRVQSLRRLAAIELEARHIEQARALYEELRTLRPDDADAAAGLEAIEALLSSAESDVREAREQVPGAATTGEDAIAAWTRVGDAERKRGDVTAAEEAYRAAIEAGSAPEAEAALESLMRESGRLDDLVAFWTGLLDGAPRARQVLLRRRLFRLLHDELDRPEEARRFLVLTSAAPAADADDVVARARAAGADGDWDAAIHVLEDGAANAASREAKIAILLEAARVREIEQGDLAAAERAYRRVRVTDPRDLAALSFYRRWYADHGEPRRAWANLVQLHTLLEGPELAGERIDVATEMASLAEEQLESWDKAIEGWRHVLEDAPRHPTALAELARIYAAAGRWHALVDHTEAWIRKLPEEATEQKIELLFELIGIYQDPSRLPMPELVVQTHERIVALSPTSVDALDGLAGSLAEREQWKELVGVLGKKVEVTDDPEELLGLFEEIASLWLDRVQSETQAIPVLERILELAPDNLDVIDRLKEIYRKRHDSERLYATYERELALLSGADRIEVLIELATLATDPLFRPDDAIRWWRQVLSIDGHHEQAQAALEALHAEQSDWPGYVALLEQRAAEARTRKQKVEVLLELGEIVYTRLDDPERAQAIFTQIAELSPFNTTARQFLQRLYVARRAWDELRALYTPREDWKSYTSLLTDFADRTGDRQLAADIHVELARAFEEHLEDTLGATRHLELALKAAPERTDVARDLLGRVDAGIKGERRVAPLESLGRHGVDPAERFSAWEELARLQTTAGHGPEALEAWRSALVNEAALGTVASADGLETAADAAAEWQGAFEAMQEALGRLPTEGAIDARLRLHRGLGNLASVRLGRTPDAVQHYRWVLQLAPGDAPALDALEKIHFSQNDFEGLEEVFKARADAAETATERVAPLIRLGQLYEDVLVDMARAASVYQEILALAPADEEAQEAVARVLGQEEAYTDLAAIFETALTRLEDPDQRRAVDLRLATLYADKLDQPLAATDHYQAVLEDGGEVDGPIVDALERLFEDPRARVATAPLLEEIYRRREDPGLLVEVLTARLDSTDLTVERLALLDEIAMLSEGALGDVDSAFEAMLNRFQTAPGDRDTWRELERLAEATDSWEELAASWHAQVDSPNASLTDARRVALRMALAEIYHRRLIEVDEAVTQVELARAEATEPAAELEALEALEVLYKKVAELDKFVEVKLAASERVISRDARRRKILDACQALSGPLDRLDEAVQRCSALLEEDPADADVGDALGGMLARADRYDALDALLDRRLSAITDREQRDALSFQQALLRRDQLGRWEDAINQLLGLIDSPTVGWDARQALLEVSRAKESEAQRDLILEALSGHYAESGDAEGRLAVLLVEADFAPSAIERAALLRQAGAVCTPDPTAAAEDRESGINAFGLYSQALYEQPEDTETLTTLVALAGALDHWEALADNLEECGGQSPPRAGLMPIWREIAVASERHLDDVPRAIAAWRHQLDLRAADPTADASEALDALDRLFADAGDREARLDILERKREQTSDPAAIVDLLVEQARIHEALDRPDAATSTLQEALALAREAGDELSDARADLVTRLETLLTTAGRHADVVELLLGHAADHGAPDEARLLRYRAAEVTTERLDDRQRAADIYREVLAEHPTDEVSLEALDGIFGELEDWASQAEIKEAQLALALEAEAQTEATALRLVLGALYDERLDAPHDAAARYAAILGEVPDEADARARLEGLVEADRAAGFARSVLVDAHRRTGDHAALAGALEAQLAAGDLGDDVASTHAELSHLYRGPLDAPQDAWTHACAAYARDPLGEASDALRREVLELADTLDDEPALSEHLLAVAATVVDPIARLARRLDDIAALRERQADDALLLPHWRGVLRDSPTHADALAEVEAWARDHDDDELLIDVLTGRIAAAAPEDRAALQVELGRVMTKVGRSPDDIAGVYRAVLTADPLDRDAFLALVRVETRRKGWPALAELYQARLALTIGTDEAPGLRKRLARLRAQHLSDPAGAVALYSEVLDEATDDAEAIAGLEELWGEGLERGTIFHLLEPRYESVEDWDKLIALYTSTLESEQDTELQEQCLRKMAALEAVLDRPDAAYATMRALVERKEATSEDLDQLEALADKADRWQDLATFYEARVASGRADAAMMARLARLQETQTGDLERAIHFYRFALEREPADRAVRERLAALLERTARWDELVALYVVSADATEDDDDRVALWFAAARLLDDELDRPDEAVELLEQVVDVQPADPDAHEVIVALLERIGEHEALHDHLRRWIEMVATDEQAVDLQVRLGRSLVGSPGTVREGLTELADVFGARPDHPGVVMALEEMLDRADELEASGEDVPEATRAATAEAASMLAEVVGDDAGPEVLTRIVAAQLRAMAPGEERQATLARLGGLLAESGDWEQAFARYAEALEEDLGNVELEAALEAIAAEHGAWEALGELYERCADSAERAESVADRYLLKVGTILHDRLARQDDAVAWFERLLTVLPTSRDALEPLAAYYRAHEDAVEEARILSQWVDAADDDELATLLRRLAVLRMDQLGDAAGAIDALERTLPESAADDDVVSRLERLYVKTGAFDRLAVLYENALELCDDDAREIELLAKTAQVCETRLHDQERARDACRRILAIDAQHGFALTTLERVERALGDWEAVDEVLGWRIAATTAKDRRAKLLIDRAEVAMQHRSDPDAALAYANEADDLAGPGAGPDHLVAGYELLLRSDDVRLEASRRLQRRYKARKAWPRLVNAIMIEQRTTLVPDERVALTERAADVAERKLGDAAMASRLVVTAFKADPELPRLRALAEELAERTGDWAPLVAAGANALEGARGADLVVDLGMWLAPLQEKADDAAAAVRTYETVLGADPGCAPAVEELMRLYETVGDWRGLKDLLLGRLNEVKDDDEREETLLRLAGVVAEHESPAAAVPILRELLAVRPENAEVLERLHALLPQAAFGAAAAEVLEPVYRQSAAWKRLVDLYETRAAALDAPNDRAALLRSAATVYEEYLEDRIAAFKTWARSVHEAPDERAGIRQMERLGASIGAWDQLVRVLGEVRARMSERAAQRDALLHMAQIHEVHLTAPEKAIVNLLAVLELEPRHRGAMVGLHRLYKKRGDLQALADMTRTLAAVEASNESRRMLWNDLYEAATEAGDGDAMMSACLSMLSLDPGDREAAERLLPLYEAEGLYPEMIEVIARLADNTEDAAEESRLKLTLARLREEHLDDRAGAIEAYEEAWELDGAPRAAERLEACYAEDGRWSSLASLLRARISRAESAEEQVAVQLRLAKLQAGELANADEATQTYVEVLDEAPEEMAAYDALVTLYAKQRRYAELARVLERKADVLGDVPEGHTARVQAAAVLLDQLDDASRAARALEQVLTASPEHAEGLLLMARLHVKQGEPAKAAALLKTLVAEVEGMRRFRILLELARIHARQLQDPDGALPFAREAREIAPDNPALHTLLRGLLAETGDWAELLPLLTSDYEAAKGDGERGRRALALARIHHERTGDDEAFALWIGRAEEALGDDDDVAALAVDHFTAREDWDEVAPRLERLVDHMVARHEVAGLAERAHELGGLFERLGQDDKAAAAYRRALEADGTYVPNLVALGGILIRLGEWAEAQKVHQSLLMQSARIEDDEVRDDVLYNLALASLELGQKARAKQYLQKLDKQAPGHAAAALLRERLG